MPAWVWVIVAGWLALVAAAIVALSGRNRDDDAVPLPPLDLPPEPGKVRYGDSWVHPDCLESLRLGYPGLDCCRRVLWGDDIRGHSKPFWPPSGFRADAAALRGDVDLTDEEREAVMREIDRVWGSDE